MVKRLHFKGYLYLFLFFCVKIVLATYFVTNTINYRVLISPQMKRSLRTLKKYFPEIRLQKFR
ncbi:hypothetical protein FM106_00785 [Brachybacterium faecium]|nr:hypothetical protein FM106_00785 [Brachybacterium faecium]